MVWGSIISAGASLAGGLLANKGQKSVNSQNVDMQYDFAKNGLGWKIEDAKKYNIHPLAAIGAPTVMPNAYSVGGNSVGDAVRDMGQDLGRAAQSYMTRDQRKAKQTLDTLTLERAALQNDLLRAQVVNTQRASNPAFPVPSDRDVMPGQAQSFVDPTPMQQTVTIDKHNREPGQNPSIGYLDTGTGYFPVYSENAKERLEEDLIGNIMWQLKNRVGPAFGRNFNPPVHIPPQPGKKWYYDSGEYRYRSPRKGIWRYFDWN